ncbi:hypothetical protein IG631_19683 [Alternaria alternata]|nr:hypothetical protein IG631_19683 [Alternaria alternata]
MVLLLSIFQATSTFQYCSSLLREMVDVLHLQERYNAGNGRKASCGSQPPCSRATSAVDAGSTHDAEPPQSASADGRTKKQPSRLGHWRSRSTLG